MKKFLIWGVPAVILLALVGWRFANKQGGQGELQQQAGARRTRSSTVEVDEATSRTIIEAIETSGSAESPYRVEIAPKTTGRIEFIEAREGDLVEVGQVLVQIDPAEVQSQVLQQQANVAEVRSRLAQAQLGQRPNEVGVAGEIRQQTAGLASAKADLNQVQESYKAQVAGAQADVADSESRVSSSESQVKNAEAVLNRAQAGVRNAQGRFDRTDALYKKGYVAAQALDDARTDLDVEKASEDVARAQLASAKNGVTSAKAQLKATENQALITKQKGLADIQSAKARVAQAQAGMDVASANRSQTPAYMQNLAALRANVQAAEAQLGQARTRLSDTVLKSPIKGTVTSRSADAGALASPGNPVLIVQYLDWLYVTASLPMDLQDQVHQGMQAEIRFDALPNRVFGGPVTNINPAADVASRQFGLRIKLHNSRQIVKPGMYGRIQLVTRRVDAQVVVPREAVKTVDGKSTVTVVDGESIARVKEVRLGASDVKGVEILSGVNKGDKVVVLSYSEIKDEQEVTLPGQGREGKGDKGAAGASGGEGRRNKGSQ